MVRVSRVTGPAPTAWRHAMTAPSIEHAPETAVTEVETTEELVVEDLLVEDVSIDGMCGVY